MARIESVQRYVDRDRNSYKRAFDHDWAKTMFATGDQAGLSDHVFALGETWKGAATTAALPWLLIEMCAGFGDGYSNKTKPYAWQFLDAIAASLAGQVVPPLTSQQKESLSNRLIQINDQLIHEREAHPHVVDRDEMWNSFMGHPEFVMMIVNSQKTAFADIFFGYEHFLASCFRHLSGNKDFRVGRKFSADLSRHYSSTISVDVWAHPDVAIPRLVRHAIAHNGARETSELAKTNHGFAVIDGVLQITPSAIRVTLRHLQDRVA